MTKSVFSKGRIFDGQHLHKNKALIVEHDKIIALVDNASVPPEAVHYDLKGNLLVPGFIDLQVNGGGGELFNNSPSVETLSLIFSAHRQFGTTAMLPTLVSDSNARMQLGIDAVSQAMAQKMPGILGIHLEGPCLNTDKKGVHNAHHLRPMDAQLFSLVTSLDYGVTLLTLAPECVETDVIEQLVNSGLVVFAGHSAASYEQTLTALQSGLRGFTHLYNAMPPLHSREPGILAAALLDQDSFFGIIADGHHVHPASFALAVTSKARGKAMLVSDAMSCVGAKDKSFNLYGETIEVKDGRCQTKAGVLAGSDLDMNTAVKNAIKFAGLELEEALRMAAAYPAHAIGLSGELGYLLGGYRASMVELNGDLNVVQTWVDGQIDTVDSAGAM